MGMNAAERRPRRVGFPKNYSVKAAAIIGANPTHAALIATEIEWPRSEISTIGRVPEHAYESSAGEARN
jgi:hypothetical protein